MLPDNKILEIMHAHIRAEIITNFSVQPTFASFTMLQRYMRAKWIPVYDSDGYPTGVGHGILCNLRYPVHTYCGGANQWQGQKLLAIWNEFDDKYGVFCIDYANFIQFLPCTLLQLTGPLDIFLTSKMTVVIWTLMSRVLFLQ